MKALRKGIIFTICLMLVVCLYGEKTKKQTLTLEQMRMEIEKQGLTFTVGENDVLDKPLEYLCGLVEPPDWRQTGKFDGGAKGTRSLPASYDWRDFGVVTNVQNQGSCGSCWAFGTIGSYESCVAVAGGGLDNLSEQWLLDCNTLGYSCSGGWWGFPDLYDGVPLGSCYPYVGYQQSCNTSCPKYYPMEDWYYVGTSSGVPSTTDLKNAIYNQGPIAAAVYVDSYFQAYSGGIFSNTSSSQPNHAIVLVGWNDSGDSGGYWILKNSWGTGWGESGYMRIEYGANNIGYAAAYGVPESGPLVADFSADPTTVQVGNSVQFTDLSTDTTDTPPTSWSWTFEGGTPSSSTSQNPQVTYNTIGTYTVTLTVCNELGCDTETKIDYITVIDYCTSSGNNQNYEYIARVEVADLDNASGPEDDGYGDYTHLVAHITQGETVNVSLTPGFPGSAYTEYWKIWIDYNGDCDFYDDGEEVFSRSGNSIVTGSFIVPSCNTIIGDTRMRVSMQYNSYPDPCGSFTYGEVEDYTVNIECNEPGAINNPGFETGTTCWTEKGNVNLTGYSHSGSYAVELKEDNSSVEQVVCGLEPNTSYTISCWAEAKYNAGVYLGVKNYGGAKQTEKVNSPNGYSYQQITFTTGPNKYAAKIFFIKKNSKNIKTGFADDFAIIKN